MKIVMRSITLIFLTINLFILLCTAATADTLIGKSPVLVFDTPNMYQLPNNFRMFDHVIGSGQFSALELKAVHAQIPEPTVIIDLRQESHGFINGHAVSWFAQKDWANVGKTDQQIAADETQRLNQLKQQKKVTVYSIIKQHGIASARDPQSITVQTVQSEAELAAQNHMGYQRIYVTDHEAPSPQAVDQFIHIVQQLPQNTWIYLHCRAGDGRTTTFMTMLDIMKNAKQMSLNSILQHQINIGGIDLAKKSSARYQFIQNFYQYSLINQDNFKTTWQTWLKTHPSNSANPALQNSNCG